MLSFHLPLPSGSKQHSVFKRVHYAMLVCGTRLIERSFARPVRPMRIEVTDENERERSRTHPLGMASAVYVPSLSAKGESSLSTIGNSGTLLKSFYRTGAAVPAKVLAVPVLSVHRLLPKARYIVVSTTGPLHYAAIPLMSSMELRRESEVQSRRFSQPSYSGPDARGIEAGNHRADSAGQANDCSHRWSCVFVEERDRTVQTGYAGTATQAERNEKNPPTKTKLGLHYPP